MRKLICLVGVLATVGFASVAVAGELSVKIANGRATVIAKDVPIRQILAEWGRVGETKVVDAEKMVGGPVTLELIDVPEKEALDILLRTAAGYIAAPRPANLAGASQYDRVIVLATSRPPAANASMPPPAFGRPGGPADHAAAARRRRWGAGRSGNASASDGSQWPRSSRSSRDRPSGRMGRSSAPMA